jgi:2-methylcitrate dehydratase PrpD
MNGIIAADLAKLNFTGARKIFEGEKGFYRATSKDYNLDKLTQGLNDKPIRYKIFSNTFKPFPSCRHTHPMINATLDLVSKYDVSWQDVKKVKVYTYSGAINLCGGTELKNPYVAKWHIPFAVATALKYKQVKLESYTEARIRERDLLELSDKVQVHLDPALDALYPGQWPARVEVYLKGGDKIDTTIYYPKGDPENPISKEELIDKFRDNASVSLHPETVETLIESIDQLEVQNNVSSLLKNVQMKLPNAAL